MKLTLSILLYLFTLSTSYSQNADARALHFIQTHRIPSLDPAFKTITNTAFHISSSTPLLIFSIGIIKKDSSLKDKGAFIGETLLFSAVSTTLLKHAIKRQRPYKSYTFIENLTPASSPSFPSGHTSDVFASATALSLSFPKWYVVTPAFLWAGAVGYSRMSLGVHYPSDVLAGALVGSGAAVVSLKLNKWLNRTKKNNYPINISKN